MKFITILSILIASSFALAETDAELAQRGCIPRRDAATGNISGYDCNVAKENKGKMEMQQLGKPRKVQMKKISLDNGITDEATIKTCLASAYVLQKDYYNSHGDYADNVQQLAWGNNNCLNEFECTITKSGKSQFEVTMSSKSSKWTINQDKMMIKVK